MDNGTLLELSNITKKFQSIVALNNVSLQLNHSEILSVVGENGAGKSTLMKIISGSYPCHTFQGEIIFNGVKKNFHNSRDAEHEGIEMVYQEISMADNLSVAENILLGCLPQRKFKGFVNFKELYELSERAILSIGLADIDTHVLVKNLSTSQKQLISIAKAIYKKPKILVLDEPTSALTERDSQRLLKILSELRQQGISCIYISHKLEEVFSISDRIVVMRDGAVISTYKNDAEINRNKIIEDMVGRKLTEMYPKIKVAIGNEILRVEGLTVPSPVSFKKKVNNVSFSLRRGEILGLGGLVGSGRSELVSAIFGGTEKEAGKIYIDGKEVNINNPRDAIKYNLGYLTEDRKKSGFVSSMNIKQNISLASFNLFSKGGWINKKSETTLTIEPYKKLHVKAKNLEDRIQNLSGGNQQKVVLGKWLMSNTRILFLDEPTRGIDVGAKVEIYNSIFELAKSGVGIVLISSELNEILALCDRFIVLYEGKLKGEFLKSEINEELYMRAATGILT